MKILKTRKTRSRNLLILTERARAMWKAENRMAIAVSNVELKKYVRTKLCHIYDCYVQEILNGCCNVKLQGQIREKQNNYRAETRKFTKIKGSIRSTMSYVL